MPSGKYERRPETKARIAAALRVRDAERAALDGRADRMVVLMEALCRHLKVRVPQDRPATAPSADERSSVTVLARGRGARLVPEAPWERERFSGDRPTSTVRSKEDFWKRRD